MTRNHSQFPPEHQQDATAKHSLSPLEALGWQPYFSEQTSANEMAETPPVRIVEVHRTGLHALGDGIDKVVPSGPEATVGDWLLLDHAEPVSSKVLDRKSLFKRRAPGLDRQVQLIAANVDTAFIVSSCNQDFNIARLERYSALAFEAEVTPVILLTKADLCKAPDVFAKEARTISDLVKVIVLDARREEPHAKLADWCKPGQTVAFLGSSGVGKSTLTNALSPALSVLTQAIRDEDARGRHTTTSRQLHILPNGCTVLDTPGMREIQLTEAAYGLERVFSDLHALSHQCRFNDCAHESEPGCAVLAALAKGSIQSTRLARWKKLTDEEEFNTTALAKWKAGEENRLKSARSTKIKNRK